jgi:glutathione S-transferase
MLLHSFRVTPNNRKVEAFIKHYDLDVDIHQVSFRDDETKTDEYYAINPMRRVPALVDGDMRLWESNAILTYLARKFPETNTLPTDIEGRANADRWLHWQSCHLMPAMGALKQAKEKDLSTLTPLIDVLEPQLEGKEYVLGDLSVVDFAIASYLLTKLGRQYDYSKHPNVVAWRDRVSNLKGFVETQMGKPPAS